MVREQFTDPPEEPVALSFGNRTVNVIIGSDCNPVVAVAWEAARLRDPLDLVLSRIGDKPASRAQSLARTKIEEAIMWLEHEE